MAHLAAFALVLFAGACLAAPSSDKIVGGSPTTIERYPSIVQVERQNTFTGGWSHSCGANILNQFHLLSAAHCFEGADYLPARRRIRAGTTTRGVGGSMAYIAQEFNHPSYRVASRFDGDITVLRLTSFLTFSDVIQPGTIPGPNAFIPDGSPVVHAGWGTTRAGGSLSTELLYTQIYTISNALCAERYLTLPFPQIVTENMVCAGLLDVGGRDACQGDSGGPLYYGDNDIVIGVVSWGHGCANGTFPGLSAAVWPYSEWVVSIVGGA